MKAVPILAAGVAVVAGILIGTGNSGPVFVVLGLVIVAIMMMRVQRRILRATRAASDSGEDKPRLSQHSRLVLWSVRLFPLTFGLANQRRTLIQIAVLGGAGLLVLLSLQRRTRRRIPLDVLVYLAVAAVAWMIQQSTRWELVFVAGFLAIVYALKNADVERSDVIGAVHDSLGIFMVVNIALYYGIGLRQPGVSGRLVVTEGIFGPRPDLPLSSAITTPPAVCAAYIAGVIAYRGVKFTRRGALQVVAFLACVFGLLATNGRASIAFAVVVGAGALLRPGVLRRVAPVAVTAALLFPLVFQGISGGLAATIDGLPLMGGNRASAASLGNRSLIWEGTLDGYRDQSFGRQLVGWGATGQVTSGISRYYARYLAGFLKQPLYSPAHSSVLQVLIDSGIVGVGVLLAVMWNALRRLARHFDRVAGDEWTARLAGIAMLTTIGCAGMTDALIAPGQNQETFWFTTLLLLAAGLGARRSKPDPIAARRAAPLSAAAR